MMRIFVAGLGSSSPFDPYGDCTSNYEDYVEFMENPPEFGLVVFTGGEDVDPALYGETPVYSWFNPKRDKFEMGLFRKCREHGIPMFGICRGLQFLNVMAGGKMYQHIEHSFEHKVHTIWDVKVKVNSAHHQLIIPPAGSFVIAWANPNISTKYIRDVGGLPAIVSPPEKAVEAAAFPSIKAAGVQWHPEWLTKKSPGKILADAIIDEFLSNKGIISEIWGRARDVGPSQVPANAVEAAVVHRSDEV